MAAPATHIVYAKKVLERYCPEKNESDFIRGTSFPDIRYIAKIERNLTHLPHVSIKDLSESDPFTAGFKLHSLIDLSQAQFFKNSPFFKNLPQEKYIIPILKTYQDILMYEKLSAEEWNHISSYFDVLSDAELTFTFSNDLLHTWHQMIKSSIISAPTGKSLVTFFNQMKLPQAAERVYFVLEQLTALPEIADAIEFYYQNFEEILKEQKRIE